MEQAIPLLILGLVAGVLSGMFGIGGGVVIVPVLVTLFSYELKPAVATSLGALLLPVGIFAVIEYYRAGKMKISVSAIIALGLIVGGWFGSQLALNLPVDTLQRLYGAFLLYAAWRFMEPRKWLADIRAGTKPVEVVGHETGASFISLLILGLGAALSPTTPRGGNTFLQPGNLTDALRAVAPVGIAALAMTLVILTGGIDLSVGSAARMRVSSVTVI